ncbi:hypothetical protein DHEL01_v205723 [Diaporthe helianthi]|uniref:Myb-like domain-containing protein n=1 Tax=Diaporthe helianthi TaxID=158607 RepID=A0A2P5I072_DIAHE|nr:hypothetical protein DHEL01_v205723 [Diaporthe helianthi]
MFIRSEGPVGVVSHQGQGLWGPSPGPSPPTTAFAFDLANPSLFLKQNLHSLYLLSGKQAEFRFGLQNMATSRRENTHGNFTSKGLPLVTESQQYHLRANDFDQSMVWFQNMEDPNDAFRGPTGNTHYTAPNHNNDFGLAPGHNSNTVSLPSSSNINNNHARAHRQHNVNPSTGGLMKTEPPNATNTEEDIWAVPSNSTHVNQSFSQPINARGPQHRWPPAPVTNNDYMQAYGLPEGLSHGLPVFASSQSFSPPFDLGPTMGGMPNIDSSSSSSCRVNGSSPNTVFGSFSSSIGPPDMMDMDMREECFHSPSVFPSEVPLCHSTGAIPPAFLSRSPAHDFPVNTGHGVFPEADTVSPKMLHLNSAPSLPSSSSSESLLNPFRMDSDSEVPSSVAAVPHKDILPSSAWQARREANNNNNNKGNKAAGRKQLPDKAPHPTAKTSAASSSNSSGGGGSKRRHVVDATGDKSSAPISKKSKSKAKTTSTQSSHSQPKPPSSSSSSSSHHSTHRHHQHASGSDHSGSARRKASSQPSLASKATAGEGGGGASQTAAARSSTSMMTTLAPRSERDEYLVRSKRAGMTYKEIRKQGGFTEAESTLRGRFRTLTKPKEARVRKPEFQEDKLLKRAVIKLTKDVDEITRDNVPWKLVSEYMVGHGGSYHFGYTTVRKRWEYLMTTSDEQVKQDRLADLFLQ